MRVLHIVLAVAMLGIGGQAIARAQAPEAPAPPPPVERPSPPARPGPRTDQPPAPTPPPAPVEPQEFEQFRYSRPAFRLAIPYALASGREAGEVTVVMSDATIEGRVNGDLVVVMGTLRLGSTAVVDGSVVNVVGATIIDAGATVRRDLVIVAAGYDAPSGFSPGGEHVVIGSPILGAGLQQFTPWLTKGLLLGRVIVPSLSWVWYLVALSLLISFALAVAFPHAVRSCTETLSKRPLGAFFVGILTLLLVAPISTILAISVVGIVVIPFLLCALIAGWALGKVAVSHWIGSGIMRPDDPDSRPQLIRSVLIGFVILCIAYMIPLLGLASWAIVGVCGLGTATLTAMASLKRERAQVPPKPAPSAPPPPTPPVSPLPVTEPLAFESAPDAPAAESSRPFVPPAAPASSLASDRPADLTSFPRATFLDRLAAAVLDLVLVLIAYNLVSWRHNEEMFVVLLLGYHMAFWAWKATTVGGIVCNQRLVRTDGAPLRPADALVRGLSSLFSMAALGIGYLWILRDPERQAWHDKIAGTYVVSVPRTWPLP